MRILPYDSRSEADKGKASTPAAADDVHYSEQAQADEGGKQRAYPYVQDRQLLAETAFRRPVTKMPEVDAQPRKEN